MATFDHLIVWDLDGTIGRFDALERDRDAVEVTIALRPGIGDALARLTAEGFAHVVLTMASPAYAELALGGAGLRHHFLDVACPDRRGKGDVESTARAHGIAADDVHHRMIFIGDHPWYDAPRDPRVVFHVEPQALRRPAAPLVELLLELRRRGAGSLRRGFDVLAAPSDPGADHATRDLPAIGPVLFIPRADECPVVAFATPADPSSTGTPVTFRRPRPPP